jgi:hypothetical protein
VEHPAGSQQPTVGESSHAAEERGGSSDVTDQHATEQQHNEETVHAAEEPTAASGGMMGFVLVDGGGAENPAAGAPTAEAVPVEESRRLKKSFAPKNKSWSPNAFMLQVSGVRSGCSTKKTTQTGPSANCRR